MSYFATRLVYWQKQHGRHHLPWQGIRNPYAIWLSEIMLQQTQVTTVIPYYQRFIQHFPTIKSLALAPLEEVLVLWSGLGYYARARHLHQAANLVMRDYHGKFPQQKELIQQLPGIGPSTAAAIAVFAFGKRCAILDGNVKRVFTRYFGINGYPGKAKVQNLLWRKANDLLPEKNASHFIETYTQALMDLGAMVCVRSNPRCTVCPLLQDCTAFKEKRTDKLPSPRPRKILPRKETIFLILISQKRVLLEKRPTTGIWGELWCLPEMEVDENISHYCAKQFDLKTKSLGDMQPLDHVFTHFKLRIHPRLLHAVSPTAPFPKNLKWIMPDDALKAAIPTPVRKLLRQLLLSDKLV